jgi:hypothetical protein
MRLRTLVVSPPPVYNSAAGSLIGESRRASLELVERRVQIRPDVADECAVDVQRI